LRRETFITVPYRLPKDYAGLGHVNAVARAEGSIFFPMGNRLLLGIVALTVVLRLHLCRIFMSATIAPDPEALLLLDRVTHAKI
jgi:hypothetical protein